MNWWSTTSNKPNTIMNKRIYYPTTTFQQRRRLFEIWEETGDVTLACRKANVSRSTFYYWKPRFLESGYPALEEPRSRRPHHIQRIPNKIEQQIVELKRQHPSWGKLQIANEIVRTNDGLSTLSPNTVRRVLQEAGLW